MDLFANVPKTPAENIAYRMFIREQASRSAGLRADIMEACRKDVFWWLETFAWLHEPRPMEDNGVPRPKVIPFLVWDHQRPVIEAIRNNIGYRDIGIEKSRGEGMSWIGLMLALHQWLFEHEPVNIGMVSSTEKKADSPGNMDSLMAKLDWELLQLPVWMAGKLGVDYIRNIQQHTLNNLRNKSQLVAFAASSGGPRGGRYTWFLMDELSSWERGPDDEVMASSQQATKSRLVISTPLGSDGAYYKFMHAESNAVKLTLDWKENPSRNQGLYRLEDGKAIAADPINNPLPADYSPPSKAVANMWEHLRKRGFVLENRIRSPWYDQECYRADSTPTSIAQELDRDYGGSVQRYFGETVDAVVSSTAISPLLRGNISVDSELEVQWDANPNGTTSLWCNLDIRNCPPKGVYGISVDAAQGEGGDYSSNSVIEVINYTTREQVLEYATNQVSPRDLADLAVGLCRWFYDAYLSWEHMGPGVPFGNRVLRDHLYVNAFKRNKITRAGMKKSDEYGFINVGDHRKIMFADTKDFILKRTVTIHSKALGAELQQYIAHPGGLITHAHEKGVVDKTHGDRAVAFGVGIVAMQDRVDLKAPPGKRADTVDPIPGTMAYREWLFNQRQDSESEGWDDRTTADFRTSSRDQFSYN